jgi:serine/threonine protein kinase
MRGLLLLLLLFNVLCSFDAAPDSDDILHLEEVDELAKQCFSWVCAFKRNGSNYVFKMELGDLVDECEKKTERELLILREVERRCSDRRDRFLLPSTSFTQPQMLSVKGSLRPAKALIFPRFSGDLTDLRRRFGLSKSQRLDIARQIAEGLVALHEAGIVHGDIHQGNVLYKYEGGKLLVVLSDFGCACLQKECHPFFTRDNDIHAFGSLLVYLLSANHDLVRRCQAPPAGFKPNARDILTELEEILQPKKRRRSFLCFNLLGLRGVGRQA